MQRRDAEGDRQARRVVERRRKSAEAQRRRHRGLEGKFLVHIAIVCFM